jgi:hypothetical protein
MRAFLVPSQEGRKEQLCSRKEVEEGGVVVLP